MSVSKKKGKLKKKLALGSLIQDDQDLSLPKQPKVPSNNPYAYKSLMQPQESPTAKAGKNVSGAIKNVPLWGQLYGATSAISKGISGDGTSKEANALANVISPSTGVISALEDHDNKGAILSAVNPIYGGALAQKRALTKKANRARQIGAVEDANLLNNADQPQLMKSGGKLLADRLNVEKGGHLQPVSDDAVEVKANNPTQTDSVETEDAFLDHGEIVDRKNRVFSEELGYAKLAKKLEKQKSEKPRHGKANELIENKLDELFAHQEASKEGGSLALGGYMSSKAPDFQDKLGFDTINNPSKHKNQIVVTMEKNSKALGGKLTARDAIKGEGSSRTPKTNYLRGGGLMTEENNGVMGSKPAESKGGIHIKKSHRGLLHKNLGVKAGHKIPASKLKVHSGDSAALKKRKVFAQNAKKWHHEEGGMIVNDAGTNTLGPEALGANYPKKKVIAHLKAKHESTPKKGFIKGGTMGDDGAAAWMKRTKYGLAKGGDWQETLGTIGNEAATFAPNITNAILQKKLQGPIAPTLVGTPKLQRVDPSAQYAAIDSDTNEANTLLTRNTAQASNLTSALGAATARKLKAKNAVAGQTQQINAGIQGNEAYLGLQAKQSNAERVNQFKNNLTAFTNKKLQLQSENVANLSGKLQAQSAEGKRMKLDQEKFGIIMSRYSALPKPVRDRYKNVFDYYKQEGDKAAQRLGGYIKRNTKRK